jgi:hypothetical protein
MQPRRDVAIFAGSVLAYSVLFSAIVWTLPRTHGFNPHDALITIPVVSVILSARGASWRRRLTYAGLDVVIFVLADYAFLASGLMAYSFAGLRTFQLVPSIMAVAYMFFAQVLPFFVLLLFIGRDPSILWVKAASQKAKPGRTGRPRPRSKQPRVSPRKRPR